MDYKKIIIFLLLLPSIDFSHGGRTNKYGCHNDRKNGGYHCHGGGSATPTQNIRTTNNTSHTTQANSQYLTAQPATSKVKETNLAEYKDLILKTQAALNQLGYSAGTPDGELGKQTIKAIQHFQVDNEIAVDGKPSYLLLDALLKKLR